MTGGRRRRAAASGPDGLTAGARSPAVTRGQDGTAHRIRIIGGRWKRTPLRVPAVQGLRPTPDRVRETLFNWLGQTLDGLACLDLFAGTGALGLEAASRGAATVWLVEPEQMARAAITDALSRLRPTGVTLLPVSAATAIARARSLAQRFDLVFLDPPFGQGWVARMLPALGPVLSPRARVYVETESALTPDALPGFRIDRQDRAGQVFYHLLVRSAEFPDLP